MDCGTSLVKYILFIFNAIVSIIGVAGIVYGVIILNSIRMIEIDGASAFPAQALLPIGLISLSCIVVIISFMGCCGAIREDVTMTFIYAVFLFILLIVQITAVVFLFTNKDKFLDAIGNVVDNAWEKSNHEFDTIQTALKCCGSRGIQDYVLIAKVPPPSCCNGSCLNPLNAYGGCRAKLQEYIGGQSENAKIAVIGLIVVELVGFIFACCLANNVRNYKRRGAY